MGLIFALMLFSPNPHAAITQPLHWHFEGAISITARKAIRKSMAAAGNIEDPTGNVAVGRFGGLQATFLDLPYLDGFVSTHCDAKHVIDAQLIVNRNVRQRDAADCVLQLSRLLVKGQNQK